MGVKKVGRIDVNWPGVVAFSSVYLLCNTLQERLGEARFELYTTANHRASMVSIIRVFFVFLVCMLGVVGCVCWVCVYVRLL